MPRSNGDGTNKIVWWGMGILATLITTISIILISGALSQISDHSTKITKLEVKVDALETKVTQLETKLERKLNPRPWEVQQQQFGGRTR